MANWGIDLVNSLRDKTATAPLPPFIIHLKLDESMQIDEAEHGRVVQNWTPGPHFGMPDGFVQGGLFCTIADISQGVAMLTTLDQFENWATLDFHIRFMRLVRVGEVVRIESTGVNKSRNNALIETVFAAVGGKPIARVTGGWARSDRERQWGVI